MAAKKDGLVVSITTDADDMEKGFNKAETIIKQSAKEIEKEANKMVEQVAKKLEKLSPKSQLRQLNNLALGLKAMGAEGTLAFSNTVHAAGLLKAEMEDVKGLIDAARPDAPFQALSTSLTASAQAFAGVQGAMALFGSESEDLQKTLVKVQAAMALAEGFKAIDGLTDGFKQLNLVIRANPLMAGAAAFSAIVAVLAMLADSTEKVTESQKMWNDITEKSTETAKKEASEVRALSNIILDESQSRDVRNSALEKLQQKYPDYLGNMSIEKSTLEDLKVAIDNVTAAIFKRAKVQAAMDKITELGAKQLDLDLAQRQLDAERQSTTDFGAFGSGGFDKAMKARQTVLNAQKKQIEEQVKELTDFIRTQDSEVVSALLSSPQEKKEPTKKSVPPVDDKEVRKQITALNDVTGKGINPYASAVEKATENLQEFNQVQIDLSGHMDKSNQAFLQQREELKKVVITAQEVAAAIKNAMVDAISQMAYAMGEAMAKGENVAAAMGDAFLQSMSSFLKTFGQMLIAAGVAKISLEKMIEFGGGVGAVLAGVALVAASGALSAHLQKGVKAEKFADGGIVAGTSYSGDRVHALVNSGEMILNHQQQSRLFNMLNTGGTNNGYIASTRIDGRDLYLVVEKAKKDMSR